MASSTSLASKALILLAISKLVISSPGDRLDEFEDCLFQCQQISCYHNPYHVMQEQYREPLQKRNYEFRRYEPSWKFDTELPQHLRFLLWDCKSNCDYQCQRIITRERKDNGNEVYQFHGKWPFVRVYGIQEFFSALFSVANFVPHFIGFRKVSQLRQRMPKERAALNPVLRNVQLLAFVTMCAWTCSTVFHIRDFLITERLDYYFAGLTVLTGLYAIGYRYLRLYLQSRQAYSWIWTALCMTAYVYHLRRLVTDWLYTYNMRANIVVGVLQNVVWGLTCFSLYSKFYKQEISGERAIDLTHLNYIQRGRIIFGSFFAKSAKLYSLYPLLLCGIVILGMSLEIFDFAPILGDLIDAHSLWHLVTVFPALLGWYDWMLWDIEENVWEELRTAQQKKNQ
ncbi:Per1-domain-containing protein [Metschnikowia bicuspidata var. bicuspidata NRRL YB-4993]|uniref:Post-GPI attachment to proteins factor 3 n=1 Tax=Metschnikowia bicuspidata var. bicuspidata NRRL YB-4993 TaxID=869754 RepID=A0A1A0H8G5_9ASCO|nr:Per1-domain-containing protein [Metschnikowia bicuspidata var. bicuspidata NRRL YB-4993]OBA20177.1 Per1-domain-containing protein [Metschnikowia bicuspidata var. bicuspidata NRRL YB-4993]